MPTTSAGRAMETLVTYRRAPRNGVDLTRSDKPSSRRRLGCDEWRQRFADELRVAKDRSYATDFSTEVPGGPRLNVRA